MAANLRGFRWGLGDELASHTAADDVHARPSGADVHARGTAHSGPGDVGHVRPDGSVEYPAETVVRGELARALSERRTVPGSGSPTRAPPDRAAIPKGPAGSGDASGSVHSGQLPRHLGAPAGTPSHAPATPILAARAEAAGVQHGAPLGYPSDAPAGGGTNGDAAMGGAGPPSEPAFTDDHAGDGLVWPPTDSTIPQLETWLDAMRILPIDPTVEAKWLLLESRLADARAAAVTPPTLLILLLHAQSKTAKKRAQHTRHATLYDNLALERAELDAHMASVAADRDAASDALAAAIDNQRRLAADYVASQAALGEGGPGPRHRRPCRPYWCGRGRGRERCRRARHPRAHRSVDLHARRGPQWQWGLRPR